MKGRGGQNAYFLCGTSTVRVRLEVLTECSLLIQQRMGTWWQHWGDKGGEERNWPPYLVCQWLRISVLFHRHSPTYKSILDYFCLDNNEKEVLPAIPAISFALRKFLPSLTNSMSFPVMCLVPIHSFLFLNLHVISSFLHTNVNLTMLS